MKRIVVLGTSNSIMGRTGYLRVWGTEFEVINLSVGRCPVHRHISALIAHEAVIASADLLVLEHYVNDVSFYAGAFEAAGRFDAYMGHVERFYRMVAAQNVAVLNLLFPLPPGALAPPPVQACLGQIIALSRSFGFALADLNALPLGPAHFRDPVHVVPAVSSLIGLGLLPEVAALLAAERPTGGAIGQSPYRRLTAAEVIGPERLEHFENSLIALDHGRLERPVTLDLAADEELVGLGYFRPFGADRPTGITVNGAPYHLADHGYFLESLPPLAPGPVRLGPLTGRQAGIPGLMGRAGPDGEQAFVAPQFVDALVWRPGVALDSTPARRAPGRMVPLAPLCAALGTLDLPQVPPRAVDALRDMALRQEKTAPDLALALMRLARIGRPDGPLIIEKIRAWEKARDGKP